MKQRVANMSAENDDTPMESDEIEKKEEEEPDETESSDDEEDQEDKNAPRIAELEAQVGKPA